MRTRLYGWLTVILVMILFVTPLSGLAQSFCITLLKPDDIAFPNVRLVARVYDSRGFVISGLDRSVFSVQESAGPVTGPDIKPEVIPSNEGAPIAISLVLDTRNGTSREELNVARDFARSIVESLKMGSVASTQDQDQDQIELWVPGLSSTQTVPFDRGDGVTLINAINQVLPYPGTSAGLDELLRQIFGSNVPGNLPHVVIVVGKIGGITSAPDIGTLTGLAQRRSVVFYSAPVESSVGTTFLTNLALTTGGLSVRAEAGAGQVLNDLNTKYKGQYLLTYQSPLTPTVHVRQVSVLVSSNQGSGRGQTSYQPPLPSDEASGIRMVVSLALLGTLALLGIIAFYWAFKRTGGIIRYRAQR